jgi:hypothetical protein
MSWLRLFRFRNSTPAPQTRGADAFASTDPSAVYQGPTLDTLAERIRAITEKHAKVQRFEPITEPHSKHIAASLLRDHPDLAAGTIDDRQLLSFIVGLRQRDPKLFKAGDQAAYLRMIAQLKQKPALTLDVEQQRRAVYYTARKTHLDAERAAEQRASEAAAEIERQRLDLLTAALESLDACTDALDNAKRRFKRVRDYIQSLGADPKPEPSRPQQYLDNRQDKHGSYSFSAAEESTSVLSKIK